MSLLDTITAQMKTAMRAKDKPRLGAIRGIRAAFIEAMKADGADTLSDEQAVTILRRLAKARAESITAYVDGGREELAEVERVELAVIEEFLPSLADEATTRGWVAEAIERSGATSMRDMGKVMGMLMSAHKAEVDGKLAQTIVKELLAGG
ncbi:MAG: GatB/YqeY domain-containing protein [Myxococcota bacterium]